MNERQNCHEGQLRGMARASKYAEAVAWATVTSLRSVLATGLDGECGRVLGIDPDNY